MMRVMKSMGQNRTKRFLANIAILGGFFLSAPFDDAKGDALFKINGKSYQEKDLGSKGQMRIHEAKLHYYQELRALSDEAALDIYFEELAKKENKTVDAIREAKLSVGEPTEDQLKKFYEENKARIPYPFDQIKSKLGRFWQETQSKEKVDKLLAELASTQKYELLVKEPAAPKVSLQVADFPVKGNKDGKVTVVEFADYKCPHCKEAYLAFKEILEQHKDAIKFVFVDFPLNSDSARIAEGAVCAQNVGKYWEYHAYAFENQGTFKDPVEIAESLKLDVTAFKACTEKGTGKDKVEAGRKEGERVGIAGTPAIFINGFRYASGVDKESIHQAIKDALGGKKFAG